MIAGLAGRDGGICKHARSEGPGLACTCIRVCMRPRVSRSGAFECWPRNLLKKVER